MLPLPRGLAKQGETWVSSPCLGLRSSAGAPCWAAQRQLRHPLHTPIPGASGLQSWSCAGLSRPLGQLPWQLDTEGSKGLAEEVLGL